YLNSPEQTAKAFIPNPFSQEAGYDRVYRTGDIVRFLPDGSVDFIGRNDGQVKVRGFRIELSEVERVIRQYPGIKDATVADFDAAGGGKYLAAYVVSDDAIDIDKLNAFILERKPPYMVPAVTMQIDSIPLNQNQKVNKKALPVPERQVEEIVLPQNEVQQKIFDCIAEVIGSREFGITTDIYEAGLTSIGAIRLNVLLAKTFDVVVRNRDLKENNTIEKLERFVACAGKAEAYDVYPDYPLTQTQNGIFVESVANAGTTVYNIPYLFRLSDRVDLPRLKAAVEHAIEAHPYVKTTLFLNEQGDVRAARNDGSQPMVELVACTKLPANEELVVPYELVGSSLYRVRIYETGEGNYLFLDFHHIICDGASAGILLRDINRAYAGETLTAESYSGFEIALDEEKLRGTDAYEKAKQYYTGIFEGVDGNFLPPRDADASAEVPGEAKLVSGISVAEVEAYCKHHDITLNAFFNGVFALVLSRYNYRDEAVYTTIYNGRNDARLADTVSMLVKTLPVYCKTEGSLRIADMLKTMKNHLLDSMANDLYSFGEISRACNLSADILFAYQGDNSAFDTIAGEQAESCPISLNAVKAPLSVDVMIYDGKLVITAEYQNDRYARGTVDGMLACMNKVTEEFLRKTYIKDVSMLCDASYEQMEGFNATDYPVAEVPIHKLFERQAELHGEETAVIADGRKLTYRELNSKANKLAHLLVQAGLAIGEAVGLILPRTVDVPVAEYGIWKAGGAFLPMLPDYPDDRIAYCLKDSGSRFVVTTKAIREGKKELFAKAGCTVLTVEELAVSGEAENLNLDIPADSLAYIIYTSGSTGTPKGVMIEHRNLCNFVDANQKNHETLNFVSYGKTALSVAAISFDFSLMEMHISLCNGMTLCMANGEEIYNPLSLLRLIKEHHVDVISGTPSFISNFVDAPEAKVLSQVKMYDFGAEVFPEKLYEKLHRLSPEAVIVNGYGPTETTISCISKVLDGSGRVTIGTPAANVRAYICDLDGNILPAGARGELVICGAGVGRGYVNLPEKTGEAFITLNGKKAYRSGDMARYNHAGEIEFFGRLDNQVKLRGLRVELDEISSVMSTYPSVTHAVVVVKGEGQQQFLCGYYVAEEAVDKAALTAHLKKSLAPYMVPSVLMQLDTMPLNANGKINKRALPEPELSEAAREYAEPVSDIQRKLAGIFAKALGVEKVGITDDFFALGGTSLTASKVAMQAMLAKLPVSYGDIFDNPTVEKLERFVLTRQEQEMQETASAEITADSHAMAVTGADRALAHNINQYVDEVAPGRLGDVLLTGATGFLGIHVLKELLEKTDSVVYCLIRRGKAASVEKRLKGMFFYYFSEPVEKLFGSRIQVVEGDITDAELVAGLDRYSFKTVINCAACVKHFVNDDILDRINVQGVENLVEFCSRTGRRLVQISTVSIAGDNVNDKFPVEKRLHENELFFGQSLENKYIDTKFRAEKAVLEAVADGRLDGKVIRVGNLMSRHSDGEFQINFVTNGFMRTLRGYAAIGKFPVSSMDESEEFSPIDCTAEAIVHLSGVDSRFTVFHACNSHRVQMGDVVEVMNQCGLKVDVVSEAEFAKALAEALADEQKNMLVSGLISYLSSDSQNNIKYIDYDNVFTIKALYRLGYKWPITDEKYLGNAFMALKTLGFFDVE
ncbi:MAG: amino acid adenylation domain-containing protein, partial [Anaerovibrio sp.]